MRSRRGRQECVIEWWVGYRLPRQEDLPALLALIVMQCTSFTGDGRSVEGMVCGVSKSKMMPAPAISSAKGLEACLLACLRVA
jgi:hypothetical protein